MPANYLHGVETIENTTGPVPVRVVKSAVIGLVGIAPEGATNQLIAVNNPAEAAQFGSPVPGYNIPQALAAIFKQGYGTVLVVNVFSHTMLTYIENESITVANRKAKLSSAPIGPIALVQGSGGLVEQLTEGTDFTIDAFGNITIINPNFGDGSNYEAAFNTLDSGAVTNSVLIGGIDNNDVKTGFALFDNAYNMFGYKPKVLICPGYSDKPAIRAELVARADKYKGIALIDQTLGVNPSDAISDRGPSGDAFNTSSKRAFLLYPHLKAYDAATDDYINTPYSQWMAGVIAATDFNEGYWVSPSNHEIKGIVGVERNISAAINDPSTEANALNEAGIATVFNSFGTGIRTWGNRSAAFPSSTHPSNFICVQRTADILHESVELAMLQFLDKPINQAVIDSIRETVNAFMRTLISRGALVDGKNADGLTTGCYFDKAKNPPSEIAAGKLTFDLVFMPPTPAEWITFNSFIDISLLSSLS
jgi:phage tail sheath protein FI